MHAPKAVVCVRDGADLVDSRDDPLIGRPLDRYVIEEKLGEGGMGCVYRARHTVLDRTYAIKVLFADFASDQRFLTRFRREAQSMSRVRHENIVTVEDFGTSPEGQTFLAMELVEGRTLEQVIRTEAPLPPVRAARLLRQMAAGLGAAHAGGFVHRDVKPSNAMVSLRGSTEHVKILDFGAVNLSRVTSNERLTHVGHIIGTPTYMAPEQSQDPNVGPTADLYALGVVLFEMLTGRPPFDGPGRAEVLVKHITLPPPELPPHGGLERVVAHLLRKLPFERPSSTEALIELLDALDLDGPEHEATAVTPIDMRAPDLSSAPTPPTRTDPNVPSEDLRALYEKLRERPASDMAEPDDVIAQDTFRPLASGLDWEQWSEPADPYHAMDADTDETREPSSALADDLVVGPSPSPPSDVATRPAQVVATQVVRERIVQAQPGEPTDPVPLFPDVVTPLAPTHESDDGGPTQIDFEIPEHATAPMPAASRPPIRPEVSALPQDASVTLLDGDEPEDLASTVALVQRFEQGVDPEALTPDRAPVFTADTVTPAGVDSDDLPTSESKPPLVIPASLTPVPTSGPGRRPPPVLYYVAIAGLSLLILVLGWILLSGRQPVDLEADDVPSRPTSGQGVSER